MLSLKKITVSLFVVIVAAIIISCDSGSSPNENNKNTSSEVSSAAAENSQSSYSQQQPTTVTAESIKPEPQYPGSGNKTRLVENPDHDLMGWIYYDWSGMDPELQNVAENNVDRVGRGKLDGKEVNEFNRDEVIASELARLQPMFEAGKGVGAIIVDVGGNLSQYDSNYGEFYISAFAPGGGIHFAPFLTKRYRGGTGIESFSINLELVNTLDAYVWKLSPDEAAQAVEKFSGEMLADQRYIVARTKIKLLDATPSTDDKRQMKGRIVSMELLTKGGKKLAEFDFTDS